MYFEFLNLGETVHVPKNTLIQRSIPKQISQSMISVLTNKEQLNVLDSIGSKVSFSLIMICSGSFIINILL